jgi:hypothetical protein
MRRTIMGAVMAALAGIGTAAAGQAPEHATAVTAVDVAADAQPQPLPAQAVKPTITRPAVKRWLDLSSAQTEARYRYLASSTGAAANQMQHKQTVKLGVKFDAKGRYSVQTAFGTGSSITGSWDSLGPGAGVPTLDLNMRQLYLAAAPVKGVNAEVGGLALVRGESTEITTYDNDAYLVGERLSVKRPQVVHLDELAVTVGYLGDLKTPNVLRRLDRLGDHNFTQVLAGRTFGVAAVSGDWTSDRGVSTLHQGLHVATRAWSPVVEGIRFEQYERLEGEPAYGFAIAGDRRLTRRARITAGYADIDPNVGALTGDRYARGHRVFTEGKVTLLPELSASFFYTHAFNNDFTVANNDRLDVISYNVLKALQQHGLW